jgi:MoaA/NifB/PqqE/SkfB family radical SAM enzyme
MEVSTLKKRDFNKLKAELKCLSRLKGLSIPQKIRYLSSTFFGETMRRRLFTSLGLRLVEISLTDRCQCRCGHCFAANQKPLPEKDELSTLEVENLIDDLSKSGVTEVCFSGGEPLLRNDILDLISYAHRKGLVTRLITNGVLLSEQMVVNLKDAGLNWCSVSIDDPEANVHDAFRRNLGCYQKAINGLKLLVKYKVPCNIITVARRELVHSGQLEKIVKIGKQIGVTVVRINFPVPIGRFANKDNETLNIEEREEVRKLLNYGNVVMENPKEGTKCTAAVTKINILPNGDVTPCVFVPLSYGNIREKDFFSIWKSMAEYNNKYKFNGQCSMCDPIFRERIYSRIEEMKLPN